MSLKEVVIGAILIGFAGAVLYVMTQGKLSYKPSALFTPSPTIPQPTPTPPPIAPVTVGDGYGEMKLTMKATHNSNGTKMYSFFTAQETEEDETLIFNQTLNDSSVFTVPENTWSPSRQYVFVQEETPNNTRFLLINASGEPFAEEKQYLDIRQLFDERITNYRLNRITGWNAPNLMIMYTYTLDGDVGPRYWYDVDSNVFLQVYDR